MKEFLRAILALIYYVGGFILIYAAAFILIGQKYPGGPIKGGILTNGLIFVGAIPLLRFIRRRYWLSRRND